MNYTPLELGRLIDISAVHAEHSEADIVELVDCAKAYNFIAVHVLPCWVPFLRERLQDRSDILIGAPVGFSFGAHKTAVKVEEARLLVKDGVQEMDMMINIGKLRAQQYQYVEEDIRSVVDAVNEVPVKVILETHYLNESEIKKACEICINAGAEFVKTSTGMAPTGATLQNIRLITTFVGNSIKVKAAGGIRDLDTFKKMHQMGVDRFGINVRAAMALIDESDPNRA